MFLMRVLLQSLDFRNPADREVSLMVKVARSRIITLKDHIKYLPKVGVTFIAVQ